MAIKTRLEILEEDYNSALTQLLENEINIEMLELRKKEVQPGKEFDEIQVNLEQKTLNTKRINMVLDIITEKMSKEQKK
jgi:hypothetical protein